MQRCYLSRVGETLFDELKRYVGFNADDEHVLRGLQAVVVPEMSRITDVFYQRILDHDGSRKALEGGESRIGQLKLTLQVWLQKVLSGPWDEAYFELRCRIGRLHVRIALPQHYMFAAMNVLRSELNELIDRPTVTLVHSKAAARSSLGKILDLELAIMLHTYREDLMTQQSSIERLATFGQLVGSIGHELRNPLGVMESSLHILKSRLGDDARAHKHADRIGTQIDIANKIITDLLDMIRDNPLAIESLDVGAVITDLLGSLTLAPGVTVELEGFKELPRVNGDAGQLRQLFLNLLENAGHACGAEGQIRVFGSTEGPLVRIVVQDTGPGVDDATRRRLFEPLVTTKEKGVGLGLALVKRIVERHGGSVRYEHRPEAGARFVVEVPRAG